MTTSHIGKIARLSHKRREGICRRIQNGLPGGEILKWLNKLKDVQAVLKAQFGGRLINQQNLTAWRHSGYMEWLKLEEARGRVDRLAEKTNALTKRAGKRGLGDGLAILLALEMHGAMETLLTEESDPAKRWERVRELHREVSRLRRDDDRVKRTVLREQAVGERLGARGGNKKKSEWPAYRPLPEVPQGEAAAREAAAACKGEWDNDEDQHPDSKVVGQDAAGEDELRQIKANQDPDEDLKAEIERLRREEEGEEGVQNPKAEARPAIGGGGKVQFLHEERLPLPEDPGYEILFTKDNKYGTRYRKVPIGWQDPEAEAAVQNPESKVQSLGAEARPAEVGNSQTGKSALREESNEPEYDPDPEKEAYIQWWLMNRNFKPFDYEKLQRLYAAIPKKVARRLEPEIEPEYCI